MLEKAISDIFILGLHLLLLGAVYLLFTFSLLLYAYAKDNDKKYKRIYKFLTIPIVIIITGASCYVIGVIGFIFLV